MIWLQMTSASKSSSRLRLLFVSSCFCSICSANFGKQAQFQDIASAPPYAPRSFSAVPFSPELGGNKFFICLPHGVDCRAAILYSGFRSCDTPELPVVLLYRPIGVSKSNFAEAQFCAAPSEPMIYWRTFPRLTVGKQDGQIMSSEGAALANDYFQLRNPRLFEKIQSYVSPTSAKFDFALQPPYT
jgi:hypothetical protein